MKNLFEKSEQILVKQHKEMFEVIINWETANKYSLYNTQGNQVGYAAERNKGLFHKIIRNILKSHRTITIDVWNQDKEHVFIGHRPWYLLFSELNVMTKDKKLIGHIKTRFGFLKRKYDLSDSNNRVFATIKSYRWRLWTFTIFDKSGNEIGVITKKWGGFIKEAFTDADQFIIDYSKFNWTNQQRAILLFACLSIDLDFFEDNSGSATNLLDIID